MISTGRLQLKDAILKMFSLYLEGLGIQSKTSFGTVVYSLSGVPTFSSHIAKCPPCFIVNM